MDNYTDRIILFNWPQISQEHLRPSPFHYNFTQLNKKLVEIMQRTIIIKEKPAKDPKINSSKASITQERSYLKEVINKAS